MLVTKLSTSFQQICQDRLFSGCPYMTLTSKFIMSIYDSDQNLDLNLANIPTVPNSMTSSEMWIAFPDVHRIAPKLNRVMYGLPENNLSWQICWKEVKSFVTSMGFSSKQKAFCVENYFFTLDYNQVLNFIKPFWFSYSLDYFFLLCNLIALNYFRLYLELDFDLKVVKKNQPWNFFYTSCSAHI